MTNEDRSTRRTLYLPGNPRRRCPLTSAAEPGNTVNRLMVSADRWHKAEHTAHPSPPAPRSCAPLRGLIHRPCAPVRARLPRLSDATPPDLGDVTPRTATGNATINPPQRFRQPCPTILTPSAAAASAPKKWTDRWEQRPGQTL